MRKNGVKSNFINQEMLHKQQENSLVEMLYPLAYMSNVCKAQALMIPK